MKNKKNIILGGVLIIAIALIFILPGLLREMEADRLKEAHDVFMSNQALSTMTNITGYYADYGKLPQDPKCFSVNNPFDEFTINHIPSEYSRLDQDCSGIYYQPPGQFVYTVAASVQKYENSNVNCQQIREIDDVGKFPDCEKDHSSKFCPDPKDPSTWCYAKLGS